MLALKSYLITLNRLSHLLKISSCSLKKIILRDQNITSSPQLFTALPQYIISSVEPEYLIATKYDLAACNLKISPHYHYIISSPQCITSLPPLFCALKILYLHLNRLSHCLNILSSVHKQLSHHLYIISSP